MFYKSVPLLVIGLWGVIVLPLPNRVSAITPLTRAEIQNLRNVVQLIPRNKLKKRPAQKLDAIIPGDGLSTGRASLADLRFNDGSLARVGEQAIFQFLPKTRSFRLSNGTALLLIPPGRGQTRIQTPSAAAAIRGSALFVRYDQQTDTTIVGALTNSGIEVSNQEASQNRVLQAGQMMVIVKGKFQGLYDFDLRNFYQTSDMVRGLDLTRQNLTPSADPAIASVQAETVAALNAQTPVTGEGVVENPSFAELTTNPSTSSTNDSLVDSIEDTSLLNSFEDVGKVLSNTEQLPGRNNSGRIVNQPVNPPVELPPVEPPPVELPPVEPPPVNPPVEPPPVEPPPVEPPPVEPPPIEPPPIEPPPIEPPPIEPPPIEPPPIEPPPIEPPPIEPPPIEPPPIEPPPIEPPPIEPPPIEPPPVEPPPIEPPETT